MSSTAENEDVLKSSLNLHVVKYQPSIPNLVYQYSFFCNFDSERLSKPNEELGEDQVFGESPISSSISNPILITNKEKDKNQELVDSFEQPNVAFFSNKLPSIPNGDYIDNIHKKWFGDYGRLEFHHGYIQCKDIIFFIKKQ